MGQQSLPSSLSPVTPLPSSLRGHRPLRRHHHHQGRCPSCRHLLIDVNVRGIIVVISDVDGRGIVVVIVEVDVHCNVPINLLSIVAITLVAAIAVAIIPIVRKEVGLLMGPAQ